MNADDETKQHGAPQPPLVRSTLPRIQFGASKRGDLVYYAAVLLAAIASWLVALLPRIVIDQIAKLVGWLSYLSAGNYRANVGSNLSHIHDLSLESPAVISGTKAIFRTNAFNVVDLLQIPHLNLRDFEKTVDLLEGSWNILDDALSAGSGAVMITAHLGPFDYIASYLRVRNYPLTALTARTTGRFAFHFVSFLRASQHMRVIETSSSGLRQTIRLLQQGEMIVLLSDRDFFLSGRDTHFFGEVTSLPIGAVRLARDTGVPIIPFFAYRQADRYQIALRPPITITKTSDRERDITKGLEAVASELERAIDRAPGQWVLFQRAWPDDNYQKQSPSD